ncbi:MAG: SPFH domain-containing protein [Campylobacteraceae bacterium]|nr:SPFH domain-containing protein [Campylobacteraceae bacterium]
MQSSPIEIVESVTPNPNFLAWKFPTEDKEIKNGAKLIVRESQQALLLCEGNIADLFKSGSHTLKTENIPIFGKLKKWGFGFKNPYSADIYFFNTYLFINNKWGTPAPILVNDPRFGNIRVRAFGSFDIRIEDAERFFRQYAGTYTQLTIGELQSQLRDFIAPKFGEILSNEKIPVMEIAGNITEFSKKIEPLIAPYFAQMGLLLTSFIVSSVTLPDEVSKHIDTLSNMNMTNDIGRFKEFQSANAIGKSAGVVVDITMKKEQSDEAAKLRKLKSLFDEGLIDEAEYKEKKAEILSQFDGR